MKQSKKRISFNIIDVLLILAVAVAAFLLVRILTVSATENAQDGVKPITLEYQIKVSPLRKQFEGNAVIGDKLRDRETGTVIGEIVDVVYSDYLFQGVTAQGIKVESPHPDYVTMTLTVRAEATMQEQFVSIGEYEVQSGKTVGFCLPNLTEDGIVTSMLSTERNSAKEEQQ